ncbi:hypothetical protein LSAT2_014571 [Lamellibrachia satsuma]|nr:hypothetical protein LSAT2_014571 [Lamellibrachia satsuma]
MTALTNVITGFTLESYGTSMLETFCRDKDDLIKCFDSSANVCPESLVDEWKNNLQLASKSCEVLDCTKKIIACGSNVARLFSIGVSNDFIMYIGMGTGLMKDVCSEMTTLKKCISGAASQCTSAMTTTWNAQLDTMNSIVCDMLPCNNELQTCFDGYQLIKINPTFDIATLHNICGVLGNVSTCVQRSTACPKEVLDFYKSTLTTYHAMCKMTADCSKSVLDCAGEKANPFFGAVGSGKFEVATLEKLCPLKDRLSTCLEQSTTCPDAYTEQYKTTIANFLTTGCGYMPCAKKMESCVGVSEMGKIFASGTDYGAGALEQVCKQKDTIVSCLDGLTPECPSDYVQIQRQVVDGYLQLGCQFVPCLKKVQECHVNMLNGTDMQKLNPASLIVFCTNVITAQSCLADLNSVCPASVTRPYQEQMSNMAKGCSTVACTNQLVACFGKHSNNLMNPTFDARTLTNACSDIDNINTCVQNIVDCPAEFLKPYVNLINGYQSTCRQIAECSQSLQDCAGPASKSFMGAVGRGPFDVVTLEKICGSEQLLSSCIKEVTTCPADTVTQYSSYMDMARMGCSFTACMKKVEVCNTDVVKTFMSGSDYAVGGLEQICKGSASIQSCIDSLNEECPSWYVQSQQMQLSITLQGCEYIPCAKKVQACGASLIDGVDVTGMNKETLVSFCRNVGRVKTCLDSADSACPKAVSDQWKGPMKDWAERCADIGGKKVAIVLKLEMTWDEKYEDLESPDAKPFVAELKNSLTEVYKDTKGFKEVVIMRLFKSSVGVEHSVEYEQELTTSDQASVAATLITVLSKNGDSLTVGNRTYPSAGTPEMLFDDKSYVLDDLCELYTKEIQCRNGGSCFASATEARCVCKYGYRGDYCETESGQSATLPAVVAIIVSIVAGLMLTAIYV